MNINGIYVAYTFIITMHSILIKFQYSALIINHLIENTQIIFFYFIIYLIYLIILITVSYGVVYKLVFLNCFIPNESVVIGVVFKVFDITGWSVFWTYPFINVHVEVLVSILFFFNYVPWNYLVSHVKTYIIYYVFVTGCWIDPLIDCNLLVHYSYCYLNEFIYPIIWK
jgi:hypothetical protein